MSSPIDAWMPIRNRGSTYSTWPSVCAGLAPRDQLLHGAASLGGRPAAAGTKTVNCARRHGKGPATDPGCPSARSRRPRRSPAGCVDDRLAPQHGAVAERARAASNQRRSRKCSRISGGGCHVHSDAGVGGHVGGAGCTRARPGRGTDTGRERLEAEPTQQLPQSETVPRRCCGWPGVTMLRCNASGTGGRDPARSRMRASRGRRGVRVKSAGRSSRMARCRAGCGRRSPAAGR